MGSQDIKYNLPKNASAMLKNQDYISNFFPSSFDLKSDEKSTYPLFKLVGRVSRPTVWTADGKYHIKYTLINVEQQNQ